MTELTRTTANHQQTSPPHYYQVVKWRLLAEAPWLVITLIVALIMFARTLLLSGDRFASDAVPNIVPNILILGFLVLPMILLVASGDADLSAGALVGLVSRMIAILCQDWGISLEIAAILSLLVALAVGLTNGLLVGFVKLKGIFVTFGMSFLLSGVMIMRNMHVTKAPAGLAVFARSPAILLLWILLVLGCAALMIFKPLGRRSRAGDPEQVLVGGFFSKALPFVFSSLMAWISGILLLGWLGYTPITLALHYAGLTLVATLLGGTAYYAGTGFVLSGTIALVAIVLFQISSANDQTLSFSPMLASTMLGVLLVILLPITHYYHVGIDWLYHRQNKKRERFPAQLPSNYDAEFTQPQALDRRDPG